MNNDNNEKINHCWYCGKVIDNEKYNENVPMFKVVSRDSGLISREVKYQKVHVNVARCRQCSRSQRVFAVLSGIFVFVVVGALLAILFKDGKLDGGLFFLGIGVIVLYFVVAKKILKRRAEKNGVKTNVDGHPVVEALKAEGWSLNQPQA